MSPLSSSSSACYTATVAACKTERDLSAMVSVSTGGNDILSSGEESSQFGITRKHPETSHHRGSNSPLKVSKDSHRIRKPPLPLPQVQYRPPIIIHTYSPKIIHTRPDDFMSLVQKLTGSSDTRLRLMKSPDSSKKDKPSSSNGKESIGGAGQSADAIILERQGSGGSSSATVNNCGSPSSSEDSSTFLVTDYQEAASGIKQSNSPRSPFDSNFEFDNVNESFFNQTFSHLADPLVAGSTMFNPQVKAEPMLSFHDNNPFNFLTDFMQHPGVLQASSKPAPKPVLRPQMHQQHQDLMSPYIENTIPSLGILSPNLMADFSDLASQGWSQSNFLDSLDGASPPVSHFVNQGPYLRQRQFSGNYSPSPESSTMVSLENIHAFLLT